MKYLVGIDGSRNAADAFEAVICDLLNPDKDELYITTIIKRDAVKFTGIDKHTYDTYYGFLLPYEKKAEDKGIHCHKMFAVGKCTGETLCKAVDELEIDVLVLGRRGMRELENTTKGCEGETIIGPVSEYCMKHARCHVILIRGKTPPLDFEGSRHTIIPTGYIRRFSQVSLLPATGKSTPVQEDSTLPDYSCPLEEVKDNLEQSGDRKNSLLGEEQELKLKHLGMLEVGVKEESIM